MARFRCRLHIAVALALAAQASFAAPADDMALGPRDKLKIRAYDWRLTSAELHEWPALTGEFTVGESGLVSLPVAGEVAATGLTPGALADAIAVRLQAKIGLARKPEVAVEVTERMPFYVAGRVNKPGEYTYHGRLTVLQAVSIAGGVLRRAELSGYELDRQTEIAHGEIRVLTAERLTLLGRQARLEAELRDSATLDLPAELAVNNGDSEMARVVSREKSLLDTRRQSLKSQVEALGQTENLLKREIDAQSEKLKLIDRQTTLAKKELDSINGLMAKGLAVSSRQLSIEQSVAQFESNRTDVQLLLLRAQQDLTKATREKTDLVDRRRADDLTELTQVAAQIAASREKTRTAKSLSTDYDLKGPDELADSVADPMPSLQFLLTRNLDGRQISEVVQGDAVVRPGDVLRVEKRTIVLRENATR